MSSSRYAAGKNQRTMDNGNDRPLQPRSANMAAESAKYFADNDMDAQTQAASLWSPPTRDEEQTLWISKQDLRESMLDPPIDCRSFENSSWDEIKITSFIQDEEDDEEESPFQHSLPDVEEIRMNASQPRVDYVMMGLPIFLLAILVFLGIVAGFASHISSESSHSEDSGRLSPNSVSLRMDQVTKFLGNGFSDPEALATVGSPQHSAVTWMAETDSMKLAVPSAADGEQELSHFLQRYALAVFYYSMGGENWIFDLNFVSDGHECEWFRKDQDVLGKDPVIGVSCDDLHQVEGILIPGNNLIREIPSELQLVSTLKFLSLEKNSISGPFPSGLRDLSNLQFVNLNDNNLSGRLPTWIQQLSRLRILGLSNNQFDGPIPELLSQLLTLALDGNEISGELSALDGLTALKYLYLDGNRIDDTIDDSSFSAMESIVQLGLSNNRINGSLPKHLLIRPALQVVDVSNNNLAGTFPDLLQEDEIALEFLSVKGNEIDAKRVPRYVQEILDSSHSYSRPPQIFSF